MTALMTIFAYLLGSLSSAVIVSKKLAMPDPRGYGSGNPGATNVLRSGRKDAAASVLYLSPVTSSAQADSTSELLRFL